MLSSKKLTFSLTSIIVLIAFGLVCFAPSAFADGDANVTHFDIDVKISAAESMIDVDARGTADDIQIASGRDRADRDIIEGTALTITLLVEFSQKVELISPENYCCRCSRFRGRAYERSCFRSRRYIPPRF